MKIKDDEVLFETTGNKHFANLGIIGLGEIEGRFIVGGGYDDNFAGHGWNGHGLLTKEEKIELADYMIELWGRFKEQT